MARYANQLTDHVSVLQWNCRSVMANINSLNLLISETNCDIFALCETWLIPELTVDLIDFNIIRQDRSDGYGGVLIGIKKCHSFYRIGVSNKSKIEVIACHVNMKGKEFSLVSFYIPPKVTFSYNDLETILDTIPAPWVIVGDFNCHSTAWGSDHDEKRAMPIHDMLAGCPSIRKIREKREKPVNPK